MKVLHILNELNPSGAETMLLAVAPQFIKMGIDGEILTTGSQLGPFADALAVAGYRIQHLAFRKSPLFFWQFFKLLRSNAYDVVHLHTERANFWLGIVALLTGSRCVRTIHGTFAFSGFLRWTRQWQRQLLSRLGLTHIAISQSVHDTEYKHYRLQVPIIQNWYNSERYTQTTSQQRIQARADLNLADDAFVLLTIGNCSAVKNHAALIQALSTVKQQSWVYLHVGIEQDSSEQVLAEQLNLTEQLRFSGLQTDILPFLRAADLFVMPSLSEGFGIAAIEAIATGLPALLTEVPGLVDFKSVFSGLFYCPVNAAALGAQLDSIMNIPLAILRDGTANNPIIAEQRFGIARGVNEYAALYQSSNFR